MASISSSNTSLPPSWPSETTGTSLRDASFSSYLDSAEEKYIRGLAKTTQDNNSYHHHHNSPKPKKVEDGEIDVFSADKYFNGVVDQECNTATPKYQLQARKSHTDKAITSLSRLNFQPRTPSIHSESSWNSQSALLRRVQRNPSGRSHSSRGERKSFSSSSSSSFLSCYYCCDKKSVDIENQDDHDQFSYHGAYEGGITRTIKTSFDTAEITRLNKLRLDNNTSPFVYPVSPEPFTAVKKAPTQTRIQTQTQTQTQNQTQSQLETRLNMLSWDAIPRAVEEISTSGPLSETNYYKDTDSEASSDLFEIEFLSSTAANPVTHGPRRVSDGSATPTTAYAPSEASIDWSVVTASAADFSILSDSEDQQSVLTSVTRSRPTAPTKSVSSTRTGVNKGAQKTRSAAGMLAGCKSQKAVRVAGDDVYRNFPVKGKSQSQRKHRFSDSFTTVTRFQTEAQFPAGNGTVRQSKTVSRRSSDLLYI